MNLINRNFIYRKIENLLVRLLYFIWNVNNYNSKKNGEELFLRSFLSLYDIKHKIVVFDCGANVGDYLKILIDIADSRKLKIEAHVFEPTNGCFQLLREKFSTYKNVLINQVGVSNLNETKTIYFDFENSALASLYNRNLNYYKKQLNLSEEISLIKLDDYISKREIKHINLLKLDIEGHELFALKGLQKFLNGDFIDFIQFEYGGANLDSKTSLLDIYSILSEGGFKIARVMKKGLEILDYNPKMEIFQYTNYVAISKKIINN